MHRAQSDFATAARLLAGSESLRCEVGARLMPFEVREWSRALEDARQGLGDTAFEAAWNELRRALGAPEWVAFHEGRYRFEDAHDVAYDVTHFERCLDETHALRSSTSPADAARRVQLLQSAIDVYRGEVLDEAGFGDWSWSRATGCTDVSRMRQSSSLPVSTRPAATAPQQRRVAHCSRVILWMSAHTAC